jgi:hypothetical protein
MDVPPQPSIPPSVLATRVGGKIIHDIAGAVHGVKAALALLGESADEAARAEALAYADAATRDLEARLAFCRTAFGGADPATPTEIERLSQIPFAGPRRSLRWRANQAGAPVALTRTILIFVQLSAAGLAYGGEAVASLEIEGEAWVGRIEVTGARVKMDTQALDGLSGAPASRPGRWAEGALARTLILEAGGVMHVEPGQNRVILEARLPVPAPCAAGGAPEST